MKDNDIEIVDNNTDTKTQTESNASASLNVPQNNTQDMKPQVIDTKVDKKKLKEEKKLAKKNKKKKNENVQVTSNVADNQTVNIVETAIVKGSSGSQTIGNINGEEITPTNAPLPSPIDITIKKNTVTKNPEKRVKIVTKREKIISIVITILVIAILGASGYGIYYFAYLNNPAIYDVKNITLELGNELPNSATYYITSSKQIDDMEYTIDLSNVTQNQVGTYMYSVSHKNVTKSGQIIVRDTTPPKLVIKNSEDLVFMKDTSVKKEDIVESCEDVSECTYKTEFEVYTETAGDKSIKVIARDNQGNQTEETVTIKVIDIKKTITCTSLEVPSSDGAYNTSDVYTLNFDSNDYLVIKSGAKKYTYIDYSAYFAVYNKYKEDSNYKFDKSTFSYSVENNDINTNNLTKLTDLMTYYTSMNYVCE
ncbi:MAG: hypothetical protein IJ572_01660 [Bacilli bacterium]|nr:hypothetical protein [Bacilli bacterium]